MKRKLVGLLVSLFVVGAVFTGCGGSSDSSSAYETATGSYDANGFDSDLGSFYKEAGEGEIATEEAASFDGMEDSGSGSVEYTTSRKLVYTSDVNIETKNFDDDVASIKDLVSKNGGYFEYSSINGTAEYGGRDANYTARIPSKNYQSFMDSVGSIGSVTYSNESVDDITSDYVDVQARLKTLNRKLERLEELEENAETIEDLLAIEDRINNVQYEIENYTAQMKLFDNQVDYCTVRIDLREVVSYSEVKADTFWNRFTEAFSGSFSGFVAFVQWLVIAVVYVLPYALVAGVILVIVFFATRKVRASKKQKKIEKASNSSETPVYKGPQYTDEKDKV
ncbi:MAG: DUF4349 domain-containing protein [Pseudobutyrivibrio sp.]|nr:DUF4349 domain-containing protein [Pseudobutyrivibrio sp.]